MSQPKPSSFRRAEIYGREREQQMLRDRLSDLLAGTGNVVLVGGEAGIGKSTLVEQSAAEARTAGAIVLSGGCYDLTTTPPYGPWIEIARDQPSDGDLPQLSIDRAAPSQTALFDGVTDYLRRLAATQPVLLVLEDLHWSDHASLDLQQLARSAVDALVAGRYPLADLDRGRLVEYLARQAEGNPFYTVELLRGLEDSHLLNQTGDVWQVGDVERLQVPTLLRQVLDARLARVEDRDRQWLAIASAIGQEAPLQLWSAVLDAPEADIVNIVERAAEAGLLDPLPDGTTIRFRHALLREALYQSILPPRRRELHRTIANRLTASASPDPDIVASYYHLAGDERAVEWLVRAGERAQSAYAWTTAAERLMAAVDLMPEDADLRERGWLLYRIGRLLRHADPAGAGRWLTEAERVGEALGDPVLTAYARFDSGHVQVLAGQYAPGLEKMIAGDAGLDSLQAHPGRQIMAWVADTLPPEGQPARAADAPGAAPVNLRRGTLVQWLVEPGRYREALELGEQYVDRMILQPAGNAETLSSIGDAWFGLGRAYAALGDPDRARKSLGKALECYEKIDHLLLIAVTLWVDLVDVMLPFQTARIAERRRHVVRVEQAFRQALGALDSRLPPRFAAVETLLLEGNWREAAEILELLAEPGITIETWREYGLARLGRLAREQGDLDQGWQCVHDILPAGPDTALGTTSYNRCIDTHLLAIDLALDAADVELTETWLDALDRWLDWSGAVRWRADLLLGRARHQQIAGNLPAARRCALKALELAEDPIQPLSLLAAQRFLGELDIVEKRYADAERYLSESLALADSCAAPYERALTLASLAELRIATGDADAARRLIDEAGTTFEDLNAVPSLERLNRLAARLADGEASQRQPFGLSPREVEVLRLVSQGLTDGEVADRLFISYRTVTTHLSSIFSKLGVNSRVSATRIAVEKGIV